MRSAHGRGAAGTRHLARTLCGLLLCSAEVLACSSSDGVAAVPPAATYGAAADGRAGDATRGDELEHDAGRPGTDGTPSDAGSTDSEVALDGACPPRPRRTRRNLRLPPPTARSAPSGTRSSASA